MGTPQLFGYWDYENCQTNSNFMTGAVITQNLGKMVGDMQFTIMAYGKRDRIRDDEAKRKAEYEEEEVHREGFLRNSIDFIDIPSHKPNIADRMIMEDMFQDAIKTKTPSFFMLFSGDADFTHAFESLTELGNSCLLVHPGKKKTAKTLLQKCASSYKWKPIRDHNKGFINEYGEENVLPQLGQVAPKLAILKRKKLAKPTAVFWDFVTFGLPATVSLVHAVDLVNDQLERHPNTGEVGVIDYHLYGPENRLQAYSSLPYVKCNYTSAHRRNKTRHIQNLMIPDMMSFAHRNPSSNIILITGNNDYAGVTNKLKRLGNTMLVYAPKPANSHTNFWKDDLLDLKLAATAASVCNWETSFTKDKLLKKIAIRKHLLQKTKSLKII